MSKRVGLISSCELENQQLVGMMKNVAYNHSTDITSPSFGLDYACKIMDRALEVWKSNPNYYYSAQEAIQSSCADVLGDDDINLIETELIYQLQLLVHRYPSHWKRVDGDAIKFCYAQAKVLDITQLHKVFEDSEVALAQKSCSISQGLPLDSFDLNHEATVQIIGDAIKNDTLRHITPGNPAARRFPAMISESHPWIDILHFDSSIQCSPAKGFLELRIKQTERQALTALEVRCSCSKVNITPTMHDVKPGNVVRFEVEGKIPCECVLRISIDVSDKIVLPLTVLDRTLKPHSLVYWVPDFMHRDANQESAKKIRYAWHVHSGDITDSRRFSHLCSVKYAGIDEEMNSIVPEQAINTTLAFQRPPTNIHMKYFHSKLLQVCHSKDMS